MQIAAAETSAVSAFDEEVPVEVVASGDVPVEDLASGETPVEEAAGEEFDVAALVDAAKSAPVRRSNLKSAPSASS